MELSLLLSAASLVTAACALVYSHRQAQAVSASNAIALRLDRRHVYEGVRAFLSAFRMSIINRTLMTDETSERFTDAIRDGEFCFGEPIMAVLHDIQDSYKNLAQFYDYRSHGPGELSSRQSADAQTIARYENTISEGLEKALTRMKVEVSAGVA